MRLTDEQYQALMPYKEHFTTCVKAQWTRNPGSSALDLINDIYGQVIGRKNNLNKGCSHCILRLMTEMGTIFLSDMEERKKIVEVKEDLTEVVKTEVKIKRKYTKRK